jgi:peptide/nickel transport system substrate-binding protein
MNNKNILPVFLLILFIFSACTAQKLSSPDPLVSQSTGIAGQKTITICLGEEPESLYLYSDKSQAAREILQAIYDGPIDIKNGEPSPVILENIPNLEDGSSYFTPVDVKKGEDVVNTAGDLVPLQSGVQVFPSGCTNIDCAITWNGTTPLQMDYLTATYKLKPDLTWSDGQPLTAFDSVYSFNIASDPNTPINKKGNIQTASYIAIDNLTVEWTSKPGLVTDAFEKYFWTPLPKSAWQKYSANELLTADDVNHKPIGWGAYKVDEWLKGQSIRLVKNPYYFRADEGLPYFDTLIFKFIGPSGDTALSNIKFDRAPFQQFNYVLGVFDKEISKNGCDLVTTTSDMRDQLPVLNILLNYFQDPAIKVIKSTSHEDEFILFNLRENKNGSANPLINLEVRKAISLCLNREKAIKDLSFGLYDLNDRLHFSDKDFSSKKNPYFSYDPVKGADLLDKAGWKDADNNPATPRLSIGVFGFPDGKELGFVYLVETIRDNLDSSEIVKASLGECGIGINVKAVPSEIYWDTSQADSIFQGDYDLAQLTWTFSTDNPCLLFSSRFIPKTENNFSGTNFSGFKNDEIDQACKQLEITYLKTGRDALLEKMETIINENLPMIPLFRNSKLMVAQKSFCTQDKELKFDNELAGIEEYKISPSCQ